MSSGKLWGGRFAAGPDDAAWALGVSTHFDARLWRQDIDASKAHAAQLARIGVLEGDEHDQLVSGLDDCAALFANGVFEFEAADEDLHGAIERWLTEQLGPLGGKLRAGRSRNDQIANHLRAYLKDSCTCVVALTRDLQTALADQAEQHIETLAPGYTHLQRGQPVVLAHHLLAYFWMLERDIGRLSDARHRMDESVLGAAALGGSTLDLDPQAYADDLGFDRVAQNSIDAVASRDFAAEFLAASSIMAVNLSRLAEEIVLWSTEEFGFARLGEAFATGSSIMPQKRNPDVAELTRGKAGRVIGDLVSLLTTLKGLPLAYNRDLQEDKEPVFDAVDTLATVLPALAGGVASLSFDVGRLERAASGGFALATDLAEELVRRGTPFAQAHEVVGGLVRKAEESGVSLDDLGPEDFADATLRHLLDARSAVQRRRAPFGTSPDAVAVQLKRAREALAGAQ